MPNNLPLGLETGLLQTILSNCSDGVFLLNLEFCITYWNPALKELTGYGADMAVGKKLSDFIPVIKQHLDDLHVSLTEQKEYKLNAITFNKIHGQYDVLFYSSADVSYIVGLVQKVRFVVPNENAILKNAIEAANVSCVVIQLDENQNEQIVDINQHFTLLTGYSKADVIGKNYDFIFGQDSIQLALQKIKLSIKEGKKYKTVLRNYRKDGSAFYNETTLVPFEEDGGIPTKFILSIKDLTENIQAQKKLAENRANSKAILDNIIQAFVLIAPDLRVLSFNNLASKFSIKYLSKEFEIGDYYNEYISKDRFRQEEKILNKVLKGEMVSTITKFEYKDEESWFETNYAPVLNELGDVFAIIFTAFDITERKNYEDALKDSENYYRLMFEANPHPMWIYDLESLKFLAVNKKALDTYGFTEDEFLNLTVKDIKLPEDIVPYIEHLNENQEKDSTIFYTRHHTKLGKLLDVEVYASKIKFKDKIARLVLANNVTDRRKAEMALKKSEQTLKEVLVSLNEGVWAADYPSISFNYVSPALEVVLGIPATCFLSKNCFRELIDEEDKNIFESLYNELEITGEVDVVYRINHPTGEVHWINDKRKLIKNTEGQPYRIEGIVTDVTKLQHARTELELRNKELQSFVYSLSHDLRGPMSSILGLINLCKIEDDVSNIKKYIHLIEERMDRMSLFTNDILSHSRNLNLPIKIDKINLRASLKNSLKKLRFIPEVYRSKMTDDIEQFDFYSDQFRIEEIFKIILSNAFQYIDHGQDEFRVNIDIKKKGDFVVVSITDNGSGIEEDVKPRIFEMFYRGHLKSKGAGIGLYIAKQAIITLGGKIEFESELNKGSRFTFTIPNLQTN